MLRRIFQGVLIMYLVVAIGLPLLKLFNLDTSQALTWGVALSFLYAPILLTITTFAWFHVMRVTIWALVGEADE